MKLHTTLTVEKLLEASWRRKHTLDNPGFCNACGKEAEGCEPDARNYRCEHCGALEVFGADELLLEVAP